MLESIREKFFDEWLPEIRLEPIVSVKTWEPQAPRCTVCSVGFVRFRSTIENFLQHPMAYINLYGSLNISSSSENTHHTHLCLACAVRKELYQQSQVFFPTDGMREDQRVAWPFMHRKNVKESTLPAATFSFISAPNVPDSTGAAVDGAAVAGEHAFESADRSSGLMQVPHSLDAPSASDSISAMSWTTGLNSGMVGGEESQALVLLPPTSWQTAQSNSPVKSQRLQDLDAR